MAKTKEKRKDNPGWKNLKPCKPGETHNPNGRPKGVRNWDVVMRELFETGEFDQAEMLKVFYKKAFEEGDQKAMDYITERMDGKAKERINISVADDEVTRELNEIFNQANDTGPEK